MNTASRMLSEKEQRIQQTKSRNTNGRGDTPFTCYWCAGPDKQNVCKIKREDITCAKYNKQGHRTKVCQRKMASRTVTGRRRKTLPNHTKYQAATSRGTLSTTTRIREVGIPHATVPLTSTGEHRHSIPRISHTGHRLHQDNHKQTSGGATQAGAIHK